MWGLHPMAEMTDLRYNIIRALYRQGVFKRVTQAYDAADAVIATLGLQEDTTVDE